MNAGPPPRRKWALSIKIALALVAVPFAGVLWFGLMALFRYSGVEAIKVLTFWVSYWTFTGWILAILIYVASLKILFRIARRRDWF